MCEFHSSAASKSISKTPISITIPAVQILSNLQLPDWRGSITTFNGFTGTRPAQEFENIPWPEVRNVLCPEKPAIIEDKKHGKYFIPCLLMEAPLVGSTLEAAKKAGDSFIGKMRSKNHVTEATMLIMDVDGLNESDFRVALDKISGHGIAFLAFTTYSHGNPNKPGVRARLVIPLDRPLATEKYHLAWHGFDQRYLHGEAGKADSSGANLYQQQGTRCCHPSRVDQAQSWHNNAGIASADALIEIGRAFLGEQSAKKLPGTQSPNITISDKEYPLSDANKIAERCNQIREFRDKKGANQAEPLWRDCLGIVGHCRDGEELCQEWSSGHPEYDSDQTAKKLEQRMKTGPSTCAQFKKSNPPGCNGCIQQCNSPITLGWIRDEFKFGKGSISNSDMTVNAIESPANEQNTKNSNPAIPSTDANVIITSLAAMSPLQYDRIRLEKAKELGVQAKTLDAQVKKLRNEKADAHNLLFTEIEPYPEPINLSSLLDEISGIIRRFVIVDKNQADAAVLWIAHTYLIDIFDISPIAIINAPEKACAKTLFQTLLARMAFRALPAANASVSALFRAVEAWKPTIFFDEADTFFRENKELQGLINAGYKRGGYVLRSESTGESFEPRMFSVYSAKSIAGISLERHLPDSTMSRGIIINMRRKLPHESVTRMRHAESQIFETIVSKLSRFAIDYAQQVRLAQPKLPDELSDREQDNWEALLAIAECAGPEWLHRATEAALELSNSADAHTSSGNELLADIQHIFSCGEYPRKISTVDLIKALIADDESPWATYNYGKPITPRQLAKLLSGYGIKSKTVRLGHVKTPKGYNADQFSDAFARYLPSKLPQQCNDSPEASNDKAIGVADKSEETSDTAEKF